MTRHLASMRPRAPRRRSPGWRASPCPGAGCRRPAPARCRHGPAVAACSRFAPRRRACCRAMPAKPKDEPFTGTALMSEGAEPSEPDSGPESPAAPRRRMTRRPSDRYRREDPRRVRHRLAVSIATAVSHVAWRLPDPVRNFLADRFGDIWIRTTPVYRANVLANLHQVLGPEVSRHAVERMAVAVFRQSARNFAELLRLRHLSGSQLRAILPMAPPSAKKLIRFEGAGATAIWEMMSEIASGGSGW